MGHTLAGLLHRVVFLYVGDTISQHSLHVCLVDLSILRGTAKYTVSGDWYICLVDLVASRNAGQTRSLCGCPAKSWMHFMSRALNNLDIVWPSCGLT